MPPKKRTPSVPKKHNEHIRTLAAGGILVLIIIAALVILNRTITPEAPGTPDGPLRTLTGEPSTTPFPTFAPQPITKPASRAGWVRYENPDYGFAIEFPEGSFVKDVYSSGNSVRIQNYTTETYRHGIEPGEFFFEFSRNAEKEWSVEDCTENLDEPVPVRFGSVEGYKGFVDVKGGDTTQYIYRMCVVRDGVMFGFSAYEDQLLNSRSIIDSIVFP